MSTATMFRVVAACGVSLLLATAPARAATFFVSGTLSGTYPVSASADFLASGTTLTLTLRNTSTTPTVHPAQVLTSFYFDLFVNGTSGTTRPTLTYQTGSGNVFKLMGSGSTDVPYLYTPPTTSPTAFTPLASPAPSNIKSSNPFDYSWYYRGDLDESLLPNTKYGIGTVGNSGTDGFSPNDFPYPYVDQIDFGIYTGDADPQGNLANLLPYLVKDSGTFTFTSNVDLTNAIFPDPYVFGFGTDPDQYITVLPEPAGLAAIGAGLVAAITWRGRRRSGTRGG